MEFTQEAQPDANAVLHTSNDVRLYVIKENLSFYSPVFRKMFESAEAYERNLPILKVLEPASLLERMLPYFWPHFDGQLHHEDTTFCSKNTRIEGYVAALNFLEKYEFPFKAFQKHFVTLINATLTGASGQDLVSIFKKDFPTCLHDLRHSNRAAVADALPWSTENDAYLCPTEVQILRALKVQRQDLRALKQDFDEKCRMLVGKANKGIFGVRGLQGEYYAINSHLQGQLSLLLTKGTLLNTMADVRGANQFQGVQRTSEWTVKEGLAQMEAMLFGYK